MGLTDDESTRVVLAGCAVLAMLLVFFVCRDAGMFDGVAEWLASR